MPTVSVNSMSAKWNCKKAFSNFTYNITKRKICRDTVSKKYKSNHDMMEIK